MNKKLKLLLAMLMVTTVLGSVTACLSPSTDGSSSSETLSNSSVKKEKYTVRFVNEDNSLISEQKVEEGTVPQAPADPTYTAEHYTYTFTGWDKEIIAVEDDVIYKAVYTKTPINYTVTFMAEGVQVGDALSYNLDNPTVTEPAVPTKEGYGGSWEAYTLDGGNKVVNAVYKLGEYTVTFKADGETVGTDTYTINDKEITEPAVPEKAHYTGVWESYTLTTGDVVVNAVYTAINYTVTFKASGEQVGDVLSYNLDNPTVTAPAVPAKEHYTGVWEEYTLDGGDKVINAVYKAIEYTVTFMADGVQVGDVLSYTLDNPTVTAPTVPAKEGYGGNWEAYTLDGGNKVVNAVYKLGEYTVTFKADGETVGTDTYTINDKEITEPAVPEKAHYTGVWESYTLTTGDVVVNAVYTAINYTVTFKASGEQVGDVLSYNLDNPTVTAPAVPAKEHYTGAWEEYTLDGGDKIINAVYTGIAYTITFFNEAGEVVDTVTYALDNMEVVEPEVPAKKGHTGVWLDYELTGGNVEVRPEYTANIYTITFAAGIGGTASIPSQDVVYGEEYAITATASSTRFYQNFLGWVDAEGNFVKGGVWSIDSDVTLTAKYTDTVTFDEDTNGPGYMRGSRIAAFSIVDDPVKEGKVLRAQTTADSTGDTAIFIKTETLAAFFMDPSIEYFAFDVMTDADRTTSSDNMYSVSYHDYRTNAAGAWTRYENGNHKYSCIPNDAFKTYYFPRAIYQSWVDNKLTDARFILAGPAAKVFGGDSFYIDNLRGATAEEYANSHYSFERGNLRTDNGKDVIFYSGNEGGWDLNFSNLYEKTAKFTNTITSDGGRAFTFQKRAGTTVIVLNHTTDTAMEKALREGVYIAYDLYVPEGSNASAVKDNSSGVYATLKQGWNTLYAKVDATDNVVSAFWDNTESTYVIDNIRFVTAEQYNTEMLSFEGKAGVLRDSTSDAKPTVYIYTPRDVLANRWTMAVEGGGCTQSNPHYSTEMVKDGNQSFAITKTNGYQSFALNTGGEMYSLLKNGFAFWVYADLDEQSGINGTSASNFIDGYNNKFNGGAGINVTARQWTQVVVTAENINASGRFLIIQGSTAGTYYFDGFEPIESATITYDAGSLGTVDSTTQSVVYGFDYTLKTPTAYRDFLGWYNGDELVPMTGTWNIAGNVTLTAKYADTVSFEDGVAPAYFTKADGTGDISIVDGGTDGNKMLQINANGGAPAMKATTAFLASFFNDSNVDYIAFDAKATKNNNNFRRDTKHSSGALNAVTYESDMTFTNPVDSVTYPTTGVRADGWKTFYFTRADYDFWVSQSATSARFIATGGFASGDQIYIDNVRPATAEDYSLSGYSFESVGIRVNDTGGKTLLFYMLGYANTWQFNMSSAGFTNVGLTSENATDGNSALTFTKAAGNLDINFPSDKHPYTDIVTKTGYWAIDIYAPVDTDATVSTANTLFGQDGNTCVNLVEGAWTTVYVAGSMNKLSITDTNGGTYLMDNIRSVTAEEYASNLPEYFYNAEGEREPDGSVTGLTLNGGTHNAGTTDSTAMPVAAEHVTDMAYYRFHGNYGLDDFLVFDVTGENMPIVSFFTTNVKNSVYNHAQSEDEKAWVFFNGVYNHNGLPDGGYSGNLSNRLNLIGPYKITYKADNSGSENPKSNRLSDGSNPSNPSPASLAMLSGTTDQYRVMLGWVANGDSNMNLRVYVWNLTTGAMILDKAFGNVTKADWEGDIVLYGHFGKDTVVDKVYPIVTGFDNAKAAYKPAMQTYKATWDGNGLTLGAGYYESGGVSKPKTGTTDMAYIAYNGDYGVGDYVVFDFTGSNMPVVSFFNNEVTNTVYNNADSTADSKAAVDDNAHGIMICGGMYNMQKQSGLGAVGTKVNSCRLIIVGNKKVLSWDDGSNAYRVTDGTTDAPNPLSITALEGTPDTTYRVIMGFSAAGKLEVRVINMITGAQVYSWTKTGLTSNLETGSIAIHGQFGKDTVLDSVFGVEENTTVDALLTKYAKDSDYSDEAAVELDRYAYSGPSHGQWTIDGVNQVQNVVDYRTVEQYNQYKNAGFNILLAQDSINVSEGSWATDGKLVMDKAAEAGLKVILTDGRLQNLSEPVTISGTTVNGTAWEIGEGKRFSNQASLDAYVMSCLSLYKDHPAFYGVMLGDEPSYQNAYCYGQVYQSIKRVMPECYVQYNLNPMQHNNYNMIKYWYDGSEPNSTPTAAQTEAAYKNYVIAFLDAMGTDYIQYDDYPFKSSTEKVLGIFEKTEPYIDPTALRNIQMVAEIAKERGLAVKVVTQSCLMRSGGKDGNVHIRQVTEDDARWLNNYLMGFGVKQISYFTYWTKSANSASGEWFDDGGAFVKRDGTTTALYDIMKTIMAENTTFAKTISHFDYNASKVVTKSYKFSDEHIVWGTLTSDSFKWVTGATTTTDATLVTELYDEEKYNYMYMVMNTIDPNEKNGNKKDTTQSITVTFDSSVTEFYVYDQSGNRTLHTGNTYTVSLTAGQAVYLMPKF